MVNITGLPIYDSKESLTVRFADYSNVYLLPTICYFGIITSIICLVVSFRSDESNAKTLDYIFLNSMIDFLFLVIQSFLIIIRCGVLCPYGNTYASKFYEVYIYLYVGYILVTAQVLLNIYVSYDRLKLFSGKLTNKKPPSIYTVFAVCTVISVIANAPTYLISKEVVPLGIYKPDPNSTYYEVLYIRRMRGALETPLFQNLLTVILAIKDPVMFVVLCVLSVLVCVRFRTYLNQRKHLIHKTTTTTTDANSTQATSGASTDAKKSAASSEKKENNFTFLTIMYCIKILVGNFIDSFSMIANVLSVDIYVQYGVINILGNSLFFLSHGLSFFLYYLFYNVFKQRCLEFFSRSK